MSKNATKINAQVRRDMSVEPESEVRIKAAPVCVEVDTLESWAANLGVQEAAYHVADLLDVAHAVRGDEPSSVESEYEGLAEAVRQALLESEWVEPADDRQGEGPLRSAVRSGLAFRKASARANPFIRRLCRSPAPARGGRKY